MVANHGSLAAWQTVNHGLVIFRYHTFTRYMAASYADWVIQLERPALVAPYLRFLPERDPTLLWRGAAIRRLPAFDDWTAPVMKQEGERRATRASVWFEHTRLLQAAATARCVKRGDRIGASPEPGLYRCE